MGRLWTLVVLCSVGMAAAACGSDDSDGGNAGGSAGNGAGSIGEFFGSCAKNDGSLCIDEYCAGSNCASYQADRQSKCNDEETWSTTACKSGAPARCQITSNLMGTTVTVLKNHYNETVDDIKAGCQMAGGKIL